MRERQFLTENPPHGRGPIEAPGGQVPVLYGPVASSVATHPRSPRRHPGHPGRTELTRPPTDELVGDIADARGIELPEEKEITALLALFNV
jgi:hypothetical protein